MYNTCPLTGTGQYLSQLWLQCWTTPPGEHSNSATMKTSVILFVFALLVGVALAGGHYEGYGGHGKGHGGQQGGYGSGGHGGHKGGYGHGGHKGGRHYEPHWPCRGRHCG
ncbi:uncharacterized protein LOC144179639 [Haemaphysalis longicornis]